MNKITKITINVDDGKMLAKWSPAGECDGYKLLIYNDADCKKLFRTRYSEGCRKTLLGFPNGVNKYLVITPFVKQNGKEIYGEKSDPIKFATCSQNLKLNKSVLVMKTGETWLLQGEEKNEVITDLDYRSTDPDVVSVTKEGLVTALKKGQAEITARKSLSDDGKEISLSVYVDRDESAAYRSETVSYNNGRKAYTIEEKRCVVSLTGDLMCTSTTQEQMYDDGRYDFSKAFVGVKRLMQNSNLNIAVLETCIDHTSPYEGECKRLENGAPNCNSPAAFLDAIKFGGFHALVTANNHCCDTGVEGLKTTIQMIKKRDLVNVGCIDSKREKHYAIFDCRGIRIAVLAYNCIKNGSEKEFESKKSEYMLSPYSKEKVEVEISNAKTKDMADYVIVYMHWGMMNSTQISDSQKSQAVEIAEAGADIIVGSHPHVIQQFEYIKIGEKQIPCVYSMGNFFTSMSELSLNRDGVVVRLSISKTDTVTSSIELIPTRTVLNRDYYMTVACNDIDRCFDEEVIQSAQRTHGTLYPKYKDTEKLLETITIGKLIEETGGRPNFDITPIKDIVVERSKVTYTNPQLQNSIYFAIKINNKENPCFDTLVSPLMRTKCRVIFTTKEIEGLNCVIVDDINIAYQDYAKLYRRCFNTKVIAITGSVGKTTTKNLIASVLSEKYVTDCTTASKNIPNAVADNILKINSNIEYFVLETGSAQPGQVHKSSMAGQPDACVITRIGTAHIDLMGSQQNICDTKLQILDGACADAPLFLNYDDPFLRRVEVDESHNIITYALDNKDVPYTADNIRVANDLVIFDIHYGEETVKDIGLHMHGKHNVYNALTAFAVGKWAGLGNEDIKNGLEKYRPEGLRQHIRNVGGIDIILDYISVDTVSSESSFEAMKEREVKGRRIAVLGHVMRMGDLSAQMHRLVGEQFVNNGLDLCLCFDDDTRYIAERVNEMGGNAIYFANNRYKLIKYLKDNLKEGDLVLFKGLDKYSHFEDIIEPVFYKKIQPSLHTAAAVSIDLDSGNVVYGKNKDRKMSLASMTMIMSAIVLLENFSDRLDEIIEIDSETPKYSGSNFSNIKLAKGEKYTILELISAMLVSSAFDAAEALKDYLFDDEAEFVSLMNQKAAELELDNTNFTNCLGLFDTKHYISAYDLARLCMYALQNPYFEKYVCCKELVIGESNKTIKNNNRIMYDDSPFYYPYAKGIKVANSNRAKYCLASYVERDGRRILNVLLGAPDEPRGKKYSQNTPNLRFSYVDCIKLFEYAFEL